MIIRQLQLVSVVRFLVLLFFLRGQEVTEKVGWIRGKKIKDRSGVGYKLCSVKLSRDIYLGFPITYCRGWVRDPAGGRLLHDAVSHDQVPGLEAAVS